MRPRILVQHSLIVSAIGLLVASGCSATEFHEHAGSRSVIDQRNVTGERGGSTTVIRSETGQAIISQDGRNSAVVIQESGTASPPRPSQISPADRFGGGQSLEDRFSGPIPTHERINTDRFSSPERVQPHDTSAASENQRGGLLDRLRWFRSDND